MSAPPTSGPIAIVVHSTSWSSAFAVGEPLVGDEVRQAREHGRPEERVADRRRPRRARRPPPAELDERQRREDGEPPEVGARSSAPCARARRRAARAGGRGRRPAGCSRSSSAADPPARVRAVVDVDLERDHREPVPDPGAERREEEQPEAPVGEDRAPAVDAHGRERLAPDRPEDGPRLRHGPARARLRRSRSRPACRPRRGSPSGRRSRAAAGRSRPARSSRS